MAGQLSRLHWEMTHISVTHCLDQSPSCGHAQFQRSEGGNPPVSVRGELASSHPQGPGHTKAHSICPCYTRGLHTQAVRWSCTQHLSTPPCPPPRAGQGCGPAESSCRWSFSGVEGVQPCLLQGSLLHHTAARALSQPG